MNVVRMIQIKQPGTYQLLIERDCMEQDVRLHGSLTWRTPVRSVVRQVHEYYAEFCAVNEDFFSANCPDALQLALPRPPAAAKTLLSRNRDSVLSVLLALKKKPSTIRYAVRARESDGSRTRRGTIQPLVLLLGFVAPR